MAFAVEANGAKFVYSGDAGLTDELETFVEGTDLLLHRCYRLTDQTDVSNFYKTVAPTPPEIAAMAERARVKQLVLTHFRVHMDSPQAHEAALGELRCNFSGKSSIAEDLDVLEIGR